MKIKPDVVLRSVSLADWHRQKMLDAGWTEVSPGEFTKILGSTRLTSRRVEDGWVTTADLLVGIKILTGDDPEGLL